MLLAASHLFISSCDFNASKTDSNSAREKVFLTILVDRFKQKFDTNKFVLLDVRTKIEHEKESISGSQWIDFYEEDFINKLKSLDKNQKYLIHCHDGARTSITLRLMSKLGFKEAYELKGGITAWKSAGFAIKKGTRRNSF